MDRYAGRPLVRLLECYVLDAIGALDERQREALRGDGAQAGRALRRSRRLAGRILGVQMAFPDTLPDQLRDLWARNLELARERGQSANPEGFAMAVVDQNFAEPAG